MPPVHQILWGFSGVGRIERRAQSIADPVERLKYLRRATAKSEVLTARRRWSPVASFCVAAVLVSMRSDAHLRRQWDILPHAASARTARQQVPSVWRIEETKDYEVYSNGLRIENQLAVANKPRWYPLLSLREGAELGPMRSQPAGIVFHTTESHLVPFEQNQQQALRHFGQELLLFVRNKRAYHFVIDRFGRVHRIVAESDAANHAGNSVWADSEWAYLDLNPSFLGVAFEARTEGDQPQINEAQVHAARVLTEMLRSKYNIAAEDCVTHAQVSVNPDNMRIGWHCDWGKGFPFREIGLPENYEQPVPSLYLFGFDYDPVYLNGTGPQLWTGLAVAEERLRRMASAHRMGLADYRNLLQKRYRDQIAALKSATADEEN